MCPLLFCSPYYKTKRTAIVSRVDCSQHFPTNTHQHKNHTRRVWTQETEYLCPFFPILLSGFLLVYFLLLLNICGGLFYAKHYVILIYIVRSFSCQKEGIPYEIEFPMDVSLRLMNKFLTTRTILGLWHDGHFVTWSQQRSSLKNQFYWERSSLRPITVMRTNDQEPGTMAFEKDKRPRSSWKWKLPQSSASYAAGY